MDVRLPEEEDCEQVSMKADIDSIYLCTRTMDYAAELIDTICREGSTVTIVNLISRVSNTSSSRFAAVIQEPEARPRLRGSKIKKVALGRFPNVNLFTVESEQALNFMVRYHYLGVSILNSNYLGNDQLAVLTAAFNVARYYPRHQYLYPAEELQLGFPRIYHTYAEDLQGIPFFEGQTAYNERNPNKRVRVRSHFSGHNGRIFITTVFQVLRMMGEDMENLCHVGEETIIQPNEEEFHHVNGVTLSLERMQEIASDLYMKGCLEATIAGCKNSFMLSNEQARETVDLDNKEAIVAHMTKMMNQLHLAVAPIVHPGLQPPTPGFEGTELPRSLLSEGVIRFFDIGFVFRGMEENVSLLPCGPNSMYWLKRLLSDSRFAEDNEEDNNELTRQLFQRALEEHDIAIVEGMLDALDLEFPTFENVGIDREAIEELIGTPQNPNDGEYDIALINFLQTYVPEEDDPGGLEVSQMIDLVLGRRSRSYNILGTNGQFANAHGGKVDLEMSILSHENAPGVVTMSVPLPFVEDATGKINGGQIYCPETRNMFLSQVRSHRNELLKIPDLLLKLMAGSPIGSSETPYKEVREQLHQLMSRVSELVHHSYRMLQSFSSTSVRFEFFVEFDPNYDFEEELLELIPNPAMCFKAYNSTRIREYIQESISECYNPIHHLILQDNIHRGHHRRSNFAEALEPDQVTTYVLLMEKLLVNLGVGHYQGNYIQKMQKKRTNLGDRLGNFVVPEEELITIDEDIIRERTGLRYTVDTATYMSRPIDDQVHDAPIVIRGRSLQPHVMAEAAELRKRIIYPLVYAQAVEKIRSILVGATLPEDVRTYSPLHEIDYTAISDLGDEKRNELVDLFTEELWSVYDFAWHKLIVERNKRRGNGTKITFRRFPRDNERLSAFIENKGDSDFTHVEWRTTNNRRTTIRTAGEVFKMCFGDGNEGDPSWTKDACWNLARMLESIWDSIHRAGHREGEGAGWLGRDEQENQSSLFSRDHLRYVLIRKLQERTRKVEGRTILPIVWYTRSRRNELAGLACRIIFSTANIPPMLQEEQGADDFFADLQGINLHAEQTPDEFWRAVTGPCDRYRLDYIIMYRLLYFYIKQNCHHEVIRPAQATLFNTMRNIDLGNKCSVVELWDTVLKCKNFIKNRLRPSAPTNHQYSNCRFLQDDGLWSNEETVSSRRDSATIAMLGFGNRRELLELATTSPENQEQEQVDFFSDEIVDLEVRQRYTVYLNRVGDDFEGLPLLIQYCCENGIISRRLLQMLLTLRVRWNTNRRNWVRANENGAATAELRDANLALLQVAGFPLTEAARGDYAVKNIRRRL